MWVCLVEAWNPERPSRAPGNGCLMPDINRYGGKKTKLQSEKYDANGPPKQRGRLFVASSLLMTRHIQRQLPLKDGHRKFSSPFSSDSPVFHGTNLPPSLRFSPFRPCPTFASLPLQPLFISSLVPSPPWPSLSHPPTPINFHLKKERGGEKVLTAANRRQWLRSGTTGMCFAIVKERVGCRELSLLTWVLISGSRSGEGVVGER